jgi:hypothetical protein
MQAKDSMVARIGNHSVLKSQRMQFQGAPRDGWSFIRMVRSSWPRAARLLQCASPQLSEAHRSHCEGRGKCSPRSGADPPLQGGRSEC